MQETEENQKINNANTEKIEESQDSKSNESQVKDMDLEVMDRIEELEIITDEPVNPEIPKDYNNLQIDEIRNSINDLSEKVDDLSQLFKDKIKHSDMDDEIITNMHKELLAYKDDFYLKIMKPLFKDLIDYNNDIYRFTEYKRKKSVDEQVVSLDELESFALSIQDILERYGCESYQGETGVDYTPIKQKIMRKVETDKEELHGKIEKSLSPGYVVNEKILTPERVSIYLYIKEKEKKCNEGDSGIT